MAHPAAKSRRGTGKAGTNPVLENIVQAVGAERAALLVGEFVKDTRMRIERINRASEKGDADALQQAAHDLKGTAGHFGFGELSELAGTIESACREGEAQRAREIVRSLEPAARAALESAAHYGAELGQEPPTAGG